MVRACSLLDKAGTVEHVGNVTVCGGSKLRFVAWVGSSLLNNDQALFDSLGPARSCPATIGAGRSLSVWMHGVEVWESMAPTFGAVLKRAQRVFANSAYTLARHEQLHGSRSNARVCWLGTEHDDAPARLAPMDGPPTALLLGRIDDREWGKGYAELIAAWPDVVARVPDARLIIAGKGPGLAGLKKKSAASPVAGSIAVLGFVPESELEGLFQRAHVLAMPSRQEGFGLAYIEAMRHGVPCIASRQDAGSEVNLDQVTGFNIDLDRPDELTRTLLTLLSDRELALRMGRAGHARWREHFTYSRFARRFLSIWQEGAVRTDKVF